MWQPPPSEIQKGCVHLYTISVLEVQTGTNYSYTVHSQPSEDPALQVESLHPYYNYGALWLLLQLDVGHPLHRLQLGHLKMVSAYPSY